MMDKDDFPVGRVVHHGLDEDDGPSVGYSIRLNEAGDELWIGEISRTQWEEQGLGEEFTDDMGWWLIHYPRHGEATVYGRARTWPESETAEELIRILALGFQADAAARRAALSAPDPVEDSE